MVLSIRISEEVSAQHRVIRWSRPRSDSISLVHRIKVICQRRKLGLRTEAWDLLSGQFKFILHFRKIQNIFSSLTNKLNYSFKLFLVVHQKLSWRSCVWLKKNKISAEIDLDLIKPLADKPTDNYCSFLLIYTLEPLCLTENIPLHAFLGESSCNQTVSGSWRTAGPILMLCRSGSRPPEEPATLCSETAWIFYGIDQAERQLWNRKCQIWSASTGLVFIKASNRLKTS